jgi:hypothetical protein
MKYLRPILLLALLIILVAGVWLWLNRPQKVDMAAYVPAESLVYVEANNLPAIANSIVKTDAWKVLAPAAGLKSNLGEVGWWSRLIAWTGIGPADAVVLSRAQVAFTVLGIEASKTAVDLKVRPSAALVAETQTSEWRTRSAVENRVEEFARRAYGELHIERKESDGLKLTVWSATTGDRKIVAAVMGSIAVIGNDEATVRACLAVRRGERPSLKGNAQFEAMRGRASNQESLAFGYVTQAGATQLIEAVAPAYVLSFSSDARAQSLAASVLPQLASKITGIGWSAHSIGGGIEDRYILTLQNDLAASFREAMPTSANIASSASALLPRTTYSVSSYNYNDPSAAWRGLIGAISSQLDALSTLVVSTALKSSLAHYGIDDPEKFLQAVGPEITTARLDNSGESTVIAVEVRDEKALRRFVSSRLGADARAEHLGNAELIIAKDEERGAACFLAGHLLMGSTLNLRRCLSAYLQKQSLDTSEAFKAARQSLDSKGGQSAVTLTDEHETARTFLTALARQSAARERPLNQQDFESALGKLAYTVSETRLTEEGFERTTRSSFGQFGAQAVQVMPKER